MNSQEEEKKKLAKQARGLLLSRSYGVLSTHSKEVPGYPFGSVTPFCLEYSGMPYIYISQLAQHTKNILSNPKVALTILESGDGDVQNQGRVSILADVEPNPREDNELKERYYRFFPAARQFGQVHDFHFYRLKPKRVRYIGGFGDISWVEVHDFLKANPFSFETETGILGHMNKDHASSMRHYVRKFKQEQVAEDQAVTMVGIDGEGFGLQWEGQMLRFEFDAPIRTTAEARNALVKMAQP